jgi:hypothetical protein
MKDDTFVTPARTPMPRMAARGSAAVGRSRARHHPVVAPDATSRRAPQERICRWRALRPRDAAARDALEIGAERGLGLARRGDGGHLDTGESVARRRPRGQSRRAARAA